MENNQRLFSDDFKMIKEHFGRRLIDLSELLKEYNELLKEPPFVHPATTWDRGLLLAAETAIRLRTIDPVKHAQWVDIYGGKYANPRYACSSCGGMALRDSVQDELLSWHEVQVLSDFCPHCGAKMDGGIADATN